MKSSRKQFLGTKKSKISFVHNKGNQAKYTITLVRLGNLMDPTSIDKIVGKNKVERNYNIFPFKQGYRFILRT
jgi:hypothetical protein